MIKSMEIDAQAELGWGTIRANSIVDNMLLRIACFDELFARYKSKTKSEDIHHLNLLDQ